MFLRIFCELLNDKLRQVALMYYIKLFDVIIIILMIKNYTSNVYLKFYFQVLIFNYIINMYV